MATVREKILRYYQGNGSGGEEIAIRLVDVAEQVLKNKKFKLVSFFVDPFGVEIAETIAANYEDLGVKTFGGYEGAERQRIVFFHQDFFAQEFDFDITVLEVSWQGESYITHRDVLGSLMSLGVERETFGDILLVPSGAKILIAKNMLDYFLANFTKIASEKISCREGKLDEIAPREIRVKEIKTTIASLRIDIVVGVGFGMSRSKSAELIKSERLKINWQLPKSPAQLVKVGDMLSLRGRGRVEVCEILGTTKKGRISILLKRYL